VAGERFRVTRNLALYSGQSCFVGHNVGNLVAENVAIGHEVGFDIQGANHVISGNFASHAAGAGAGFFVSFGPHTFTGNSAIGNREGVATFTTNTTIERNNLYGNLAGNCGLRNASGGTVNAPHNFWGAASGPGADPADQVCNDGSSATNTGPHAPKKFPLKIPVW
jgi:hypothetical protein